MYNGKYVNFKIEVFSGDYLNLLSSQEIIHPYNPN